MAGPYRCAEAARRRGDSAVGTAAPATRWLLIEHPGPWSSEPLGSRGIQTADAATVALAVSRVSGRAVLVRRPGRPAVSLRADADRSWVAVDTAKGVQVSGTWTQAGGLAAAADGLTHGLDEATEPAMTRLLVCTHGIHDTCCAIRGRPVAATLAARWPELVWECSHLGGDRFAATMVVLPDGACYGGLDDDVAADVVAGHLDGRVMADYLRGISTMPGPMQAAIVHALSRFGPTAIDSVRPVSLVAAGPDVWTATLAGRSQLPVRMVVAVRRSWDAPAQLTCRAERDSAPMRYTATVVEMTQRSR